MFNAFKVFNEDGKISGRLVQQSLDGLSEGAVVIKAAFSSVNYKDALAATGAGKIMRRFPLIGPVVVTGATGGVGSIAIQSLAARGYSVTALTGKAHESDYLRTLGATDVITRGSLEMGTRPLEKSMWAGAMDPVGGDILGWLTRTMMYGGCIANSGLTGGVELETTVMPFILRGVKLLGIDSVMCPAATRGEVWRRLAGDLKPSHLGAATRTLSLNELPGAFATLVGGQARGRFVVDLSGA